jgi:hypothetical protein
MGNETLMSNKNKAVSNSTVTVACKIPMGLVLKLYDWKKVNEPVMGGGTREVKTAVERYNEKQYIINGNSYAQNEAPAMQIANGFAMTYGIPTAFWEEWLSQNIDSPLVKNGLIFAHSEQASLLAESREKANEKSGTERLSQADIHKHGLMKADTVDHSVA